MNKRDQQKMRVGVTRKTQKDQAAFVGGACEIV